MATDKPVKDEELTIVDGQHSKAVDGCDDPEGEFDYVPLRRKRGRLAGSKSPKRKMEQKPALFDSSSRSVSQSDKDDHEPSDKDGNFEPSDKNGDFEPSDKDDFVTTRKRRRSAGTKSAKSKKPHLVLSSSTSDSKQDKDDNFEPEVSDDDGRKKYARVKDFYGTAWDRAVKDLLVSFCRNYLPENDVTIKLEDEDGQSYDTNYLARKEGLSGGWHGFVVQHDLKVGDAVVFQLVRPTRFKVYILRENRFSTTDGALSLLSLDTLKENNMSKDSSGDDVKSKEDPKVTRVSSKASGDDSDNVASEGAANDGIRYPDPNTHFDTVKSFRDFKIIVDGSVIDRKLFPYRLRRTYHKLCLARKAILHRHLLKQINPVLAAEVIVETVSIAEGIRTSPGSPSSLEDLAAWKKILESFKLLGMDVGFLHKRVNDLLAILTPQSPSRGLQIAAEECEGYEKVKLERDSAAEKMRALESKMSSLKDALKEMDMEMKDMLESSARKKDQGVRKLAAAPW